MSDNRSPVNPTPTRPLHTPGPWRLWTSEFEPGAFTIHGDSPHTVHRVSGENMIIASRMIRTPVGMEGVANAHLLAAAPEMLAACKAFAATGGRPFDQWSESTTLEYDDALALAIAAIAKAEGWTL